MSAYPDSHDWLRGFERFFEDHTDLQSIFLVNG